MTKEQAEEAARALEQRLFLDDVVAEASRRAVLALRAHAALVDAADASLKYIPGSAVRSWPPGWRLRGDALAKIATALALARKEP